MSVSMRPNRARPSEIARSAVFRSVMSPGTTRIWSSLVGLIDRAVATTPYLRSRYASTRAAPMPCEAPVMTATFLSLFILVSFIVAGHRYFIGAPDFANEDRLFHVTAVGSQNDYQLSILAMSDRLFAP